jgi:hypothetical protein
MELHDYARPPDDTGIGVHWSAGNAGAVGMGEVRDYWLPQLIHLGVKWVKILHDGGLELAELLLQNDIMPIVRLYRLRPNSSDPQPGKGTLGDRELEALERYISIGVRYFEFNNEPDLHGEWEGAQVPDNAETIVARNAIIDMVTILERGGYPSIPATAIGTKWDLVGKIIDLGRRDLFDGPVWIAVHNYDINHPLDYPYDAVNQHGQPLTREEYDELNRQGAWDGQSWGHRSMEWINDQRQWGVNTGHTIHDDPSCWLSYTRFDDLVQDHLGHRLPILSTENGPIVGEDDDPRYATTTPERHRDKVLEMCRIMMGTSERFDPAPPQYFCTAFWLLGGVVLLDGWESSAWYSPTRPGGRLPVVDALQDLPKQPRPDIGPVWEGGVIEGWIRNGAGRELLLDGPVSQIGHVAADEAFCFDGLRAGRYELTVRGTELIEVIRLSEGQPPLTLDVELTSEHIAPPRDSVLRGRVGGGAGYRLRLSGTVDRLTTLAQAETYRFAGLPRGEYTLAVEGTDLSQDGITLDGREERVLDLELAGGWTWELADGGPGPGFGVVRCSVDGIVDLPIRLWTEGWSGMIQFTGSKPEYGPYACEFAPLGGGRYTIEPEGLEVQAQVNVDGSRVLWVEFREQSPPAPGPAVENSRILGRVLGGAAYSVELSGSGMFRHEARVGAGDGTYRFERLPAGTYTLRLLRVTREDVRPGEWYENRAAISDQIREGIVLDGQNDVTINFDVRRTDPCRGTASVAGRLGGGAGETVVLVWPGGYRNERSVGINELFHFHELGSGTYELQVKGIGTTQTFSIDGQQDISLQLWMPGVHTGVIKGNARGGAGRQIVLEWAEGRQERTVASNATFRFENLPPGEYILRLKSTSVASDPIFLAESAIAEVRLDLEPAEAIEHYLLLGRQPLDHVSFLTVLRYAARFGPGVGSDVQQALRATHVTIIGDADQVSAADEEILRARGCRVHRIGQDVPATLELLLKEGRPY